MSVFLILPPTAYGRATDMANVSFLSKTSEKIVAYQLAGDLERNNLLPSCQSRFRWFCSRETVLLHFLSDVYEAIDRSELTLLALFDVDATFDTVDHDSLFERLHATFRLFGGLPRIT